MKQLIQNYRTGTLRVEDVPPPQLRPGGVLVRTAYSVISVGTERALVELARKSLLDKARARPDLVRKVIAKAKTEGVLTAYQKAMRRLDTDSALGYSSAGTVVAVGDDVLDVHAGATVACAGIGYASHAEVVFVPRNLIAPVPAGVTPRDAAFATMGAIALHGTRTADVRLGEAVAVIGLGLVGLLTIQILRAAGCRVVGVDLDPARVELGRSLGLDSATPHPHELPDRCRDIAGGLLADAVVVTAATASSELLELAAKAARDRARIVVVGQVGLDVPRKPFYEKELSLVLSRSYGPGRYDRGYEEGGLDYPSGYVRWTENRNIGAVLDLMARGALRVEPLVTHEFPIERALDAYAIVAGERREPHLGIVLKYDEPAAPARPAAATVTIARGRPAPTATGGGASLVSLGVIGSGAFATGVLIPALSAQHGVRLASVCSQGGLAARSAAERFGFESCTSDPAELLARPDVDAVVIATRPDSHARLAAASLAAGKHVFVEKPMAVTEEEIAAVLDAQRQSGRVLMVGFNRRFSPFVRQMLAFFGSRVQPFVAVYRVNAGALPAGDWQHDAEQGGGRLVGEAGHFVDVLAALAGAPPVLVSAVSTDPRSEALPSFENASLSIRFGDGSLGIVVYTTGGASGFAKERLEVFADGSTAVLDDFRVLMLAHGARRDVKRAWFRQDKGHASELAAFVRAVRGEAPPVTAEQYALTSICTLRALASMRSGQPENVTLLLAALRSATP